MTSHAVHQRSRFIRLLAAATALVMMMSLPTSAAESETCFSRQHQSATVNVRVALSQARTAMNTRVVHSERDCVLACCSEEIRPGLRCNMAVFKSVRHAADENCLLFHCATEQDCPLMKASDGINTYDIYKGLSHPPTLRPVTMTTAVQTTSSTTPTTKLQTTTTTTVSAPTTSSQAPPTTTRVTPTTSQAPPTTTRATPTTPQAPPTTTRVTPTTSQAPPATTRVTPTTSQAPPATTRVTPTTSQAPPTMKSPSPIILIMPMPTATSQPATIVMTPGPPPTPTSRKLNKSNKKQNKATKKGKLHPFSTTTTQPSISSTSLPATTKEVEGPLEKPTESTTPPTTTVLTTTTTVPTTTTTATPPPAKTHTTTIRSTAATTTTESSTTVAPPTSLIIVPKDILQSEHTLQNSSSNRDKTFAAQRALNSGVVAVMVVGLAMLTLALALGGRKAMESFDRRHYTRLELNDLHYEI